MLPKKFKTDYLEVYYFLDKECNWAYLRYVGIEKFKSKYISYHVFIYHVNNCGNSNEVAYPKACMNRKQMVFCSGCGVEVSETIQKQAAGLWMMEVTKYGG